MGQLTKRVGLIGAALALVTTLALLPVGAQAEPSPMVGSPPPELLRVGGATTSTDRGAGPTRNADVDTALLKPGVARRVAIDVPPRTLDVTLTPIDSGAAGWSAWTGVVAGDPNAAATVVRRGEDVAAMISTADGSYRIRTTAPGQQVVQAIEGPFPERLEDSLVPPASSEPASSAGDPGPSAPFDPAPDPAADVPTYPMIDVLVAYTPGALVDAETTNGMNSEIALAISTTNTAYANSGVSGRIRLAGTTALTEDYDLSTTSLNEVTGTSDGHSDSLHAVRNATGADLVSVLVHDPSSCGLAWILDGVTGSSSHSPYGFSTVNYSCAVSNYSFPHELGHNMGLNHDRYVDPAPTLYPYALGYVNVAAGWRTIMAYNNECADQSPSVYCERLGRFSNPDQSYLGAPLGRPSSGSSPADNRKALNNTQAFVSSWRAKPTPFTSWSKFVAQQFRDFQGRSPSGSESSAAVTTLNTGVQTPQAYIDGQLKGPFGAAYAPVTRLYYAYFVRSPDPGGLDYWVRKYQGGMKLTAISSNFAASNEFKTKYGTLSNREFVEKIYVNLFERTGDATGVSYWTGKLDARTKTRGEVMINFSESSEFKRVRAEEIDVVLLYRSMLQRAATPSEFADKVARLHGGAGIRRLILEVLDSAEYSGRVTK